MQLDVKEQEQKFFSTQWNRNLAQEITSFFFKCAFDVLQVQSLICIQQGGQLSASVNITVGALHLMFAGFLTFGFYRARSRDISAVMLFHVLSYVASVGLLVAAAPLYVSKFAPPQSENDALMTSQQFTLTLYVMTVFASRGVSFRVFCATTGAMFLGLIVQNYLYITNGTIDVQTFITDGLLNVILAVFFVMASHNREMKLRKVYNHERILEVEIEKTEELLSRLVPIHVL